MADGLQRGETAMRMRYWTRTGPARTWLVLVHGAFGSRRYWDPMLSDLGARARLLLVDLPGHGDSIQAEPCRSLEQAADHLRAAMDDAGVEAAHVLGTSFGGMVAQQFARRYPSRIRSLIACMCVPVFDTHLPAPGLALGLSRLSFRLSNWGRWCRDFAGRASIDPAVAARIEREVAAHPASVRDAIWEAMLRGARNEPDFWFECPVAQMVAELDTRFPGAVKAMQRLSARIPPTLRVTLRGTGHSAWYENPALFARSTLTLLDRLEECTQ